MDKKRYLAKISVLKKIHKKDGFKTEKQRILFFKKYIYAYLHIHLSSYIYSIIL